MSTLATVAPAGEMPDAREALRQAQERFARCEAGVAKHLAAVGRARQYVEDAEAAITEAEAAVETARESHTAALAGAAGDDAAKPVSGVRQARLALEGAKDDHEAAVDALSRLQNDDTAATELQLARVAVLMARTRLLRPTVEALSKRLADARQSVSSLKQIINALLATDYTEDGPHDMRVGTMSTKLVTAVFELRRVFEDALAVTIYIDAKNAGPWAKWRAALIDDPDAPAPDFAELKIAPASGMGPVVTPAVAGASG